MSVLYLIDKQWYIQATTFVEQLVEDETYMEGIPTGCSKIMNVNLRLEDKHLVYPKGWQMTENLDVLIPLWARTEADQPAGKNFIILQMFLINDVNSFVFM